MKNILLLLCLFLCLSINAQTEIEKGSYQFNTNIIQKFSHLKEMDNSITPQNNEGVEDNKDKSEAPKIEIEKGSKVTVVGQSKDLKTVYIKYWDYALKKKTKTFFGIFSKDTDTDNPNAKKNGNVYEIPSETFKKITSSLYTRYKGTSVGVYTIPFRLRGKGKSFDFESSLSLQANLVAGFGKRTVENSWIDVSVGLGLTGVNLNSNNSIVTEQRTASAITVSSGLVIKPSKFTNIGLFVGFDTLGANDRAVDWEYNENIWLGVGINVSFNTITTNQSPNAKDQ
ncbi:hypothetical protein [uncultured Lacinutrix sp.]|uniref:hypothetical protein n=1 Tax=uncultured Lacinutrix sp. TaxID=574032 RepID=UPI002629FBA7|nr:hypothetical protein [uncultured Lacinutrix sp.]